MSQPQTLGPKDSAKLICDSASHVSLNNIAIEALATNLVKKISEDKKYISFKAWRTHALNPKTADDSAIDWIFVVDALNFSFWTPANSEKYMVQYKGEKYTGYWSLCAAINRALDEGIPITSAEYCKNITEEQAKYVLRSNSSAEIPLLKERIDVMHEVGSVLLEKFNGKFSNCVELASNSAQDLLKVVVDNFPCFRDEADYYGKRVSFYKRAQILIADIWACFEGEGMGKFTDIDSITMFADYRIPQILVYFKVITYSNELQQLLDKDHLFTSGDEMEAEIRAASIWAVELLCEKMNSLIATEASQPAPETHMNAILLDHFLWDYRRAHDEETKHIPFHKIRCIYY